MGTVRKKQGKRPPSVGAERRDERKMRKREERERQLERKVLT